MLKKLLTVVLKYAVAINTEFSLALFASTPWRSRASFHPSCFLAHRLRNKNKIFQVKPFNSLLIYADFDETTFEAVKQPSVWLMYFIFAIYDSQVD